MVGIFRPDRATRTGGSFTGYPGGSPWNGLKDCWRMNDRVCPWWICYTFDNPLRRLIHDPERLLEPYVKPGMTVVDIGCGMGYFTLGAGEAGRSGRKGHRGRPPGKDACGPRPPGAQGGAVRPDRSAPLPAGPSGGGGTGRLCPRLLDGPRGEGQAPVLRSDIRLSRNRMAGFSSSNRSSM